MNKKLPLSKTSKLQGKTPEEKLIKGQVERSITVKQVETSKLVKIDLYKDLEKNPLIIDKREISKNQEKKYSSSKKTLWKNTFQVKLPQQFRVPEKNLLTHKLNKTKKNALKNYKRYLYFSNVAGTQIVCPHMWTNQWNNLHLQYKSLLISQLIQKYFLEGGTYVNKIYIHHYHNGLRVLADSLGVFRGHNAGRKIRYYKKKLKYIKTLRQTKNYPIKNRKFKTLSPLSNVAKLLLQINKISYVKLSFYHMYLPIKYIIKNAIEVFKKENRQRFFGESVQLVYRVFKGYASASILGGLIYTYTRKNPKRLQYLAFIKRLINWHFEVVSKSQIQGVRIEVKGRFNAKSRARKYIISTGRVAIHTVSSNVDSKQTYAITKFGMLGIKVWICPKKKLKKRKNVIITKKNKTQESPKGKNSVYRH